MNNPKISVIVPIYNVEKYLPRCIDSILSQTFTDFELLLIDDGSKDNSGMICDEYAKKDTRIRVFHKENGGVSSARNLGLNNAKGEWICFIDADDLIEACFLEDLLNDLSGDLIVSGYKIFGSLDETVLYDDSTIELNNEGWAYINKTDYNTEAIFYCPWGKLFKKQIIEDFEIRFNTDMFLAEDTCFIIQYVCHITSIRIIHSCSYRYYSPANIKDKYLFDFNDLRLHIFTFNQCLCSLENKGGVNLVKLKDLIYNVFFWKFVQHSLLLSKTEFKDEIKSFRLLTPCSFKSNLMNNWKIKKRYFYFVIFRFPTLGYYLLKQLY